MLNARKSSHALDMPYYAPKSMEHKTKHLEMIQGVVNRLSTNSFLLKGWSVALVSAFFAISAAIPPFILFAFLPAAVFWGLDAYFLRQERLYRDLYNHVRKLEETDIDFSMDTKPFQSGRSFYDAVFSETLKPFHGVLVGAIVVVTAIHFIN